MNDLPNPNQVIDSIVQAVKSVLPDSVSHDVKENVRAAMQDALNELDVVTREEFNVQKKVLARSREKIDQLEKILTNIDIKQL